MRDAISGCTGDGGVTVEDERDYCLGWVPLVQGGANCTEHDSFK